MDFEKQPTGPNRVWDWHRLYLAALFETDNQRMPSRIAEAERALHARSRQLRLVSEHGSEEGKALEKGLYALRALRTCWHSKLHKRTNASTKAN